ncbi:MAG TPA: ABC transporter permease [candidate division Zixibacteria bacterium]|nr:ABC transporter permease [candidate division Zixibacteria bacterium]
MEFLGEVLAWFTDPVNWSGPDGIPVRVGEHLVLSFVPLLAAAALALPIGLYTGHTGRLAGLAINAANVGRAIPTLGILIIAWILLLRPLVDLGLRREAAEVTAGIAMLALAIPPMVTNTYVGIAGVDRGLVDAARGVGMAPLQVLRGVELPLALPVVLAGMRTAAVQVVATATLGAVVGTGGLGRYVIDGIAQLRYQEMFAGAMLVSLLAIATELAFSWLQRRTVSPGLRGAPEAVIGPSQGPC